MEWRAPVAQDAAAVLELIVARDVADLGAPHSTLADLRAEWEDSELDLATDAVVIEDARRLVGYAILRREEALVVVGPDDEGRGIGGRLLAWAQRAERERGRTRHRQRIASSNARARELLAGAGYEHRRSYWRMVSSLKEPISAPPLPEGTRLRDLDVEADASTLHALDALSFNDNADYEAETLAQFRSEHLRSHDFDRGLSVIAVSGEIIVGFLLACRWVQDSVGYIDVLAVHPGHRHRGLASAMLSHGFAAFAQAGLREAQLDVASDNPRAMALYERVGMTPRFRLDAYERPRDD